MRRRLARAAVAAVLVAGPFVLGPAASIALAHAQLVSSTPGSGEVVASSPSEILLVFSEPLDGRFSFADVLDASGRTIVSHGGAPDPSDGTVLVVPVPALGDGAYTVNWQTLSAADGHQATGFISFGIGVVDPSLFAADAVGQVGNLHAGHEGGTALLEVQARSAADLGFLLAFGVLVVGFAVVRPVFGLRRSLMVGQACALLIAAVGGLLLGLVAGSAPGLEPVGYLSGTRPGQLILARAVVGLIGGTVVFLLLRRGHRVGALITGGIAGAAGVLLLALGGHAGAFATPAPVVAMSIHLGAAGVWLAGLLTLATLALSEQDRTWVRATVPRFSALALVSIGLVGATGVYAAWVQTGDLLSVATPYQVNLAAKVVLVITALAIGAANFLTSGAPSRRLGGFGARIGMEAAIAVAIVVAAANLASGSPPASEGDVSLSPAAASAATGTTLAMRPGRPGPNQLVVLPGAEAAGDALRAQLRLDRIDTAVGESVIAMRERSDGSGRFAADGVVLPPGSSWDATVILFRQDGSEVGRTRFAFAFGEGDLIAGRASPVLDPILLVALLLAVSGLFGLAFALAGGSVPRTERAVGRGALVIGSAIALPLAIVIVVWRIVP